MKFGDYSADRLSGPDRYATSVAVSQRAFPDASTGAPVAYLVSGLNYPDALSAGAAAAKQGGTILMTQPEALPASVVGELTRPHPAIIVVVGGAGAVSDAVLARGSRALIRTRSGASVRRGPVLDVSSCRPLRVRRLGADGVPCDGTRRGRRPRRRAGRSELGRSAAAHRRIASTGRPGYGC